MFIIIFPAAEAKLIIFQAQCIKYNWTCRKPMWDSYAKVIRNLFTCVSTLIPQCTNYRTRSACLNPASSSPFCETCLCRINVWFYRQETSKCLDTLGLSFYSAWVEPVWPSGDLGQVCSKAQDQKFFSPWLFKFKILTIDLCIISSSRHDSIPSSHFIG